VLLAKTIAAVATASLLAVLPLGCAGALEIKAMYPPPLRTVLSELIPKFERDTGHRIVVVYESSWLLVDRIRNGETPDLAFLSTHAADDLIREGKLARRIVFARSSIGIAVRAGAAKPDIASVEAFKRALLAARSFARNEGADSGLFMAGLLERLGIAEEMKSKSTLLRQGFVAELVANGEVEMAAQQMPELIAVPGVEAIPLPQELQHVIVFCAAVSAASRVSDAVRELIDFLSSPAAAAVIRRKGLEPP
jgi:molybdate transport system substrate-binding protein